MAKRKQHGGKRKGAGRPLAMGEATKVVCVRLPLSWLPALAKLDPAKKSPGAGLRELARRHVEG